MKPERIAPLLRAAAWLAIAAFVIIAVALVADGLVYPYTLWGAWR